MNINFNNISQIIKERRAVYPSSYKNKEIDISIIYDLLELANHAPTHKRTEPWRFKVFHSDDSRRKLSNFLVKAFEEQNKGREYSTLKLNKTKEKPLQSGCVVGICVQLNKDILPEWEEIAATACAVQNLWLGASSLGIGAYWSSPSYMMTENAHDFLSLEKDEKCLGLMYMGYMQEMDKTAKRSPISDKIKIF